MDNTGRVSEDTRRLPVAWKISLCYGGVPPVGVLQSESGWRLAFDNLILGNHSVTAFVCELPFLQSVLAGCTFEHHHSRC